jgi:hypothetical protein
MTASQSFARLALYVFIAMVSTASAGVMTVDFADRKQVAIFVLAILAAGANSARGYIDKSPAEVQPPKP